MIEFGKTLRAAREAKGYTVAQLAEITRLAPSSVEALENEDFSNIAAPIYGRGFVKLYCEAVGLEPKPLVDEFMDIYSGNRDTEIKERPVVEEPAVEQEIATQCESEAQNAFEEQVADPLENDMPAPEVQEPERSLEDDLFSIREEADSAPPAPRFSRYAAPMDQTRHSPAISIPSSVWRLVVLGVVTFGALMLLLFAARLLYRATTACGETQASEEVSAPAEPKAVEKPKAAAVSPAKAEAKSASSGASAQNAKREEQKIPALYID